MIAPIPRAAVVGLPVVVVTATWWDRAAISALS